MVVVVAASPSLNEAAGGARLAEEAGQAARGLRLQAAVEPLAVAIVASFAAGIAEAESRVVLPPVAQPAVAPPSPADVASASSSSQYSLPTVAIVASGWKYHYMHRTREQRDRATPPSVWPFGGACLAIPGVH